MKAEKALRLCLKLRLRNFFEKKFLNNLQKTFIRVIEYRNKVCGISGRLRSAPRQRLADTAYAPPAPDKIRLKVTFTLVLFFVKLTLI